MKKKKLKQLVDDELSQRIDILVKRLQETGNVQNADSVVINSKPDQSEVEQCKPHEEHPFYDSLAGP